MNINGRFEYPWILRQITGLLVANLFLLYPLTILNIFEQGFDGIKF